MKRDPKKDERIDRGRRGAFRGLLANILVSVDEVKGHRHCPLSDLANLGDRNLGKLIPVIDREFEIDISEIGITAVNPKTGERHRLFDPADNRQAVFNRLNGENTIARIAGLVAAELQWEQPKAFEFVKAFVLELVRLKVCGFTNPADYD